MSAGITLQIERANIVKQNCSPTLMRLSMICADRVSAWDCQNQVQLNFNGYADESRELWEVPEIRKFVRLLIKQFPYWIFFLDRDGLTFKIVYLCLVDTQRNDQNTSVIVNEQSVFHDGLNAIGKLFDGYKFPQQKYEKLAVEIMTRLMEVVAPHRADSNSIM